MNNLVDLSSIGNISARFSRHWVYCGLNPAYQEACMTVFRNCQNSTFFGTPVQLCEHLLPMAFRFENARYQYTVTGNFHGALPSNNILVL